MQQVFGQSTQLNGRHPSTAIMCLILFVACAFSTGISWAQGTQQFTGHVFDPTGAVIPEANVTVLNQATNVSVRTLSTSEGNYAVTYLKPGTYTITVSRSGFKTETKTDIVLNVDQSSTIDFQLQVGTSSEEITVNASASQIELSKADRGEIIDGERISEMPLDSRNPFGLFQLSPGAHNFSQAQYPRPFDLVTHNLYANGSPQVVELNIDGVTNEAGGTAGAAGLVPSVDVLGEYKVALNGYDASYSHGGGSAIDLSLKSGGNRFHGVADYFMRRSWLDAYPWQTKYTSFINGATATKPPHKRDQYSFELEGPLVIPHLFNGKNKLFYVISYENMHDVQPASSYTVYSIPNPAWLTGDFSTAQFEYHYSSGDKYNPCGAGVTQCLQPLTIYDPLTPLKSVVDPLDGKTKQAHSAFTGNRVPTSRIDSVGAAILSTYSYVKPNVDPGAGYAPYTNNYQTLQSEDDIWRNALIKIDYNVSAQDTLSFRWGAQGRWNTPGSITGYPVDDPANMRGAQTQPKSQTGSVQWTHTFSPVLLLNVGATLITEAENQSNYGPTFANESKTLGFASSYYNQLTNNNRFPYITVAALPNANQYGYFSYSSQGASRVFHTLQFLPTITNVRGAHTIRTGIDIRFTQNDNPKGGTNDTYAFTSNFSNQFYNAPDAPNYTSGTSIASLLLGYPNGGTVYTNLHSFYSQHYFAPWFQDDWKLTKRLTLNLGLRWDFLTPMVERHNKVLSAFNQTVLNPVSATVPTGTVALGTNTNLQGGLTFAGVNGAPRSAFALNKLQVQPRIGFAYAITDRLSLRGGIGENFQNDQATNGTDGFSSNTGYNTSIDNGITPYTATTGQGFSNPIPTVIQPTGSSLGYLQDLGKGFSFYNPNYRVPALWSYSMTLDAQITKHDVVSIAYVGNRTPNNPVTYNINMISPQWNAQCDIERGGNRQLCDNNATGQVANPFKGVAAFNGTSYYTSTTLSKSVFTQPYPEFGSISENGFANNGKNWYNSFQATASHQMSRSLSLHAAYTHAKSETVGGWVDQLNNVFARQVSTTNDVKHAVSISGVGYLPFGRGRLLFSNVNRWVDETINGWEISPLYTWYSGFPWRPSGNWEMASTGAAINQSLGVDHSVLSPDSSHKNYRIRGATPCVGTKDTDTGAIIPSASATAAGCTSIPYVTAPNGYAVGRANIDFGIRQPGAYNLNIAASKNFKISEGSKFYLSESTNLRLTVDLLNAFNHANWDTGYNGQGIDFGTINKGPTGPTNLPRYLQLSAKINW